MRRRTAAAALSVLLLAAACSTGGDSDASPTTEAGGATTTTADGGGGSGGGSGGGGSSGETTTTAGEPSGDPDQVLVDSVDATLGTESFDVSSEANLSIGGQQLQLRTDGPIDYADLVADATIGITGDGQDYEIGIRSDGETLWVRAEGDKVPFTIPGGKSWVEGDATLLAESDSFAQADLIGVVLALRAATGTEEGDTEEVDGVQATQYTTTIDYDDAVEAAGEEAEQFRSALSLTAEDPIALDIVAWVGDDGVIRRFELEIDSGNPALSGDYTVELSQVGEELEAPEAPDPADVLTGPQADQLLEKVFNS